MGLTVVNNLGEWKARINSGHTVICEFTATWCGPCQRIAPRFKEFSENPHYQAVMFVKVDVDSADDVAAACGVTAMPTFQVYVHGKKVDELAGPDPEDLLALIKKHA